MATRGTPLVGTLPVTNVVKLTYEVVVVSGADLSHAVSLSHATTTGGGVTTNSGPRPTCSVKAKDPLSKVDPLSVKLSTIYNAPSLVSGGPTRHS